MKYILTLIAALLLYVPTVKAGYGSDAIGNWGSTTMVNYPTNNLMDIVWHGYAGCDTCANMYLIYTNAYNGGLCQPAGAAWSSYKSSPSKPTDNCWNGSSSQFDATYVNFLEIYIWHWDGTNWVYVSMIKFPVWGYDRN